MTYSTDLRERVVDFVHKGGTRLEASARFDVHVQTVYNWMKRHSLAPKAYERRKVGKLDRKALADHVACYPDMMSKDRAEHFGVAPSSLCYALKQLQITRKKSN